MISPAWREVKLSPKVIEKLGQAFEELTLPASTEEILTRVLQYVIEAFREDWNDLHQTPDGTRVYHFYGDDFPLIVFYAEVEQVHIYDFSIVEETVIVFRVDVVPVSPT